MTVLARRLLNTHLFGEHPYGLRSSGTVETVGNLTREDLVEFRDRHFVGKNGVLAVFGDVKAEEVLRLRRTKPLKAWESTLDACINLKIKHTI